MLNTDLHSTQIKNKMTLEQFISNNRKIDDGEDVPDLRIRSAELLDAKQRTHIAVVEEILYIDVELLGFRRARVLSRLNASRWRSEDLES